MRGVTEGALFSLRDGISVLVLDGFERPVVFGAVSFKQYPVI